MDLGAYAKIDSLEEIMKKNNITVPRLRGLRLMSEEEPISREDIEKEAIEIGLDRCESACQSNFSYNPCCYMLSAATRRLAHKYLVFEDHCPVEIRWDKVHGKKRKVFKYFIKTSKREVEKTYSVFNKYCGRKDILYIHARIGGGNWPSYRAEVETQPWFIEKVDDPFDSTYCDIYAKIGATDV